MKLPPYHGKQIDNDKEAPPLPPPLLDEWPKLSKLQPPPTPSDKLRAALSTLDRLNCEYEIIYDNIKYTRKQSQHESY